MTMQEKKASWLR